MIELGLDKTLLDLIGVLVTGIGIYAVFTKYSVPGLNDPELSHTFFGSNPFASKRDIIEQVVTKFYTWVAMFGFALQGFSIVIGNGVTQERIHASTTYLIFFIAGAITAWPITRGIAFFARLVAKRYWLPDVVRGQYELYDKVCDILANDGLRTDEAKHVHQHKPGYTDHRKKENLAEVDGLLRQIEKLLELKSTQGANSERLARIKIYFDRYPAPENRRKR